MHAQSALRTISIATALALSASGAAAAIAAPPAPAAPSVENVRTTVLILDNGQEGTTAMMDRLRREHVRHEVIRLADAERQRLTMDYLVKGKTAQFSGIVLPSASPAALSAAELATLHLYEKTYGVREVSMFNWANPAVGLQVITDTAGEIGPADGKTVTVSEDAQAVGFGYLAGTFAVDDNDPAVSESWAYQALPVPTDDPETQFTPFLTVDVPGDGDGVLLGVYEADGRQRMISTMAMNKHQQHWSTVAHGMITWLTRGGGIGHYRNYLAVQIDDVMLANDRWNSEFNCTTNDGCPKGTPDPAEGPTMRMTPDDVAFLNAWQGKTGIKLDQYFNAAGSTQYRDAEGNDALIAAYLDAKNDLRWGNHTHDHLYLGCLKDYSVVPWTCQRGDDGAISYLPKAAIAQDIRTNIDYAVDNGIPLDPTELVTGEHSGLRSLPQMAEDSPHFGPALEETGVAWTASDASREMTMRRVGSTWTVPRYPMNIYYNTGLMTEAVDEYNWIYTSTQDGGSGLCEKYAHSTCIDPLDPATGFNAAIRPEEVTATFGRVIGNDPRPHYAHQGNLTEDRLLYPVLDDVLARYTQRFSASAPPVNPSLAESGAELLRGKRWSELGDAVEATLHGDGTLTVRNTSASETIAVPVTARSATAGVPDAYADQASSWVTLAPGAEQTIDVGQSVVPPGVSGGVSTGPQN